MKVASRLPSLSLAVRRLSIYSRQAVRQPSLQELRRLSDRFGFNANDEELVSYKELIHQLSASLTALDRVENPPRPGTEKSAHVVPRSSGHRPSGSDNPGNAWYWRCDIKDETVQSGGLLSGKSLALKDNVSLAGVPMMNGSKLLEGFVPCEDATVATRVLKAGGHIIGKAACEDLCFSGASHTTFKGTVPNPHSDLHSSGGSSSGCGYLVAKGIVDMAIGGDQGGSIRIPSAWCGIVGLKPTFGLVPYTGAMSMMHGIDHLGPMTRTVTDAALLLEAIAGYDHGLDPRQPRDLKTEKYSSLLRGDLTAHSFGVLREGFHGLDQEVDEAVRQLSDRLSKAGAKVTEVSVPLHLQVDTFYLPYLLQGFRFSYLTDGAVPSGDAYSNPESVDAMFKGRRIFASDNQHIVKVVMLMSEYLASTYGLKHFAKAANWIRELRAAYNRALQSNVDFLLMPTLPFRPPKIVDQAASVTDIFHHGLGMIGNTAAFNATGHPAITVNCGRTSDQLPIGAMLVGRHFDDAKLLDAAFGIEQRCGV